MLLAVMREVLDQQQRGCPGQSDRGRLKPGEVAGGDEPHQHRANTMSIWPAAGDRGCCPLDGPSLRLAPPPRGKSRPHSRCVARSCAAITTATAVAM